LHQLVELFLGACFGVEADNRLGIAGADIEPGAIAKIDGQPVQFILLPAGKSLL
jgi:hypothetical protein